MWVEWFTLFAYYFCLFLFKMTGKLQTIFSYHFSKHMLKFTKTFTWLEGICVNYTHVYNLWKLNKQVPIPKQYFRTTPALMKSTFQTQITLLYAITAWLVDPCKNLCHWNTKFDCISTWKLSCSDLCMILYASIQIHRDITEPVILLCIPNA